MSTNLNYHRNDLYERKLNQRVRASLEKKEDRFAREHQTDTNVQLLEYLRAFAKELGHTPTACEIIGGRFIEKRFGDWNRAVQLAGLTWARKAPPMQQRMIYRKERAQQALVFKRERVATKEEREAVRKQKAEEERLQRQAKLEQDMAWGVHHEEDTDEQLLQYLRCCAEALGHTPVVREVEGGGYIAKRFVTWPLALQLAELPLPKGMKPPGNRDINAYRRQKAAGDENIPRNAVEIDVKNHLIQEEK